MNNMQGSTVGSAVGGDANHPTVQERIDKLHALMTEALAIEARLVGAPPDELGKVAEAADLVLDNIEFGLDRAVDKASNIVSQLEHIEQRL